MPQLRPVILIEDDEDDFQLFMAAYQQTGSSHPILWFDKAHEALTFLKETREAPFMIIADMNMPVMSGLELRHLMRETKIQTLTAIPFFFFTTASVDTTLMQKGYELCVQGFFTKPDNIAVMASILDYMVQYAEQARQ